MNEYERAWVRLTQHLTDLRNSIAYDFTGLRTIEERERQVLLIRQIEHNMQTIEREEITRAKQPNKAEWERKPEENYDDLLRIRKNDAEGSDGV